MTPEQHFKRMRHDDVWNVQAPPRPAARRASPAGGAPGRRTQIWTTAVVAAVVVAVAGVAITTAPTHAGIPAGPGGAGTSISHLGSRSPSTRPAPAAPQATAASAAPAPETKPSAEPAPARTHKPSAAPAPARSAKPSAAPAPPRPGLMHHGRPAFEIVATDRADVARGQRIVACLHAKGVTYVDLAAADKHGIRYPELGGAHNDQQSISLGLKFLDACVTAAGR